MRKSQALCSARPLVFPREKPGAGYVVKLNELVEGTPYVGRPLDEVVTRTAKDPAAKSIFNNAAQAWNHDFYWRSMRPKGGGKPGGTLGGAIERDFGGLAEFRTAFAKAAAGEFGSGWAWLVAGQGGRRHDFASRRTRAPTAGGGEPLLPIDVWEHAYYLDYQTRRPDYIAAWLDKLINWEFAERNFGSADPALVMDDDVRSTESAGQVRSLPKRRG